VSYGVHILSLILHHIGQLALNGVDVLSCRHCSLHSRHGHHCNVSKPTFYDASSRYLASSTSSLEFLSLSFSDRDGHSAKKVDLEVMKKCGVNLDESLISVFRSDGWPFMCRNCLKTFIKDPLKHAIHGLMSDKHRMTEFCTQHNESLLTGIIHSHCCILTPFFRLNS